MTHQRTARIAALILVSFVNALAVVIAPAGAADPAPEVDAIVPTATWNDSCLSVSVNEYTGACRTDNALVTYYMDNSGDYALETPDRDVVTQVMNTIYDPTDLDVLYDSTPSFSGSAQTDVVFLEGSTNFLPGQVGQMWCAKVQAGSTHLCDRAGVMIRGLGGYTMAYASHEVGHAVGLTHPEAASPTYSSCEPGFNVMRSDAVCVTSPALGLMLTRNINHIY